MKTNALNFTANKAPLYGALSKETELNVNELENIPVRKVCLKECNFKLRGVLAKIRCCDMFSSMFFRKSTTRDN